MNQRERLAICCTCTKRILDFNHGYLCQLTGLEADFQGSCKHYVKDGTVTGELMIRTEERPFLPLFDPVPAPEELEKERPKKGTTNKGTTKKGPSKHALKKLKRYQNFLYALTGGLLVALVVAVGWPFVTAVTGYKTLYYESGQKMSEGDMRKGVEKGTWMHFYPDGVVLDSGAYHEGLKQGLWKHNHESGSLMFSVNYEAGEMHGERILYNSSGNVVNIDHYENGMLTEKD